MKNIKALLLICCWLTARNASGQCTSGCTTTVSTTTSTNYPVPAGQKLCVTATGKITGSITLNGGSVCNAGIIQATSFTVTGSSIINNYGKITGNLVLNSGTLSNDGTIQASPFTIANNAIINNYGYIIKVDSLELKDSSKLNNYNFVEAERKLIVYPRARYLEQAPQAVLWQFNFLPPPLPSSTAPYAKLGSGIDGGTYLASDGYLYFQYDEEYTGGTFQYKIYDGNNAVVMSNASDALPVKTYGDNRYQLKIACKLTLGNYMLEVTNDKNEVSYLKFKVNILQYCTP